MCHHSPMVTPGEVSRQHLCWTVLEVTSKTILVLCQASQKIFTLKPSQPQKVITGSPWMGTQTKVGVELIHLTLYLALLCGKCNLYDALSLIPHRIDSRH